MRITTRERAVLNHVLMSETADEWVARNEANSGSELTRKWLDAKVARHAPSYDAALAKEGARYRDAKARNAALGEN